MITLYQFPISHYCEKVRWALDHKRLEYRVVNLLPGLHLKTTRTLARRSSVPVIVTGDEVVQGSAAIISWLDEHYPDRPLTPADPDERARALELEAFVDRELGPHVRRFAYHTLLEHPSVVKPFFLKDGKWWWRPFLALSYPKLVQVMRRVMKIDAAGAEESRGHIEAALEELSERYAARDYLVGDHFSRVDLAAAALIAPMIMAEGYGLDWPERMPGPLQDWTGEWHGRMAWAERLCRQHRQGTSD